MGRGNDERRRGRRHRLVVAAAVGAVLASAGCESEPSGPRTPSIRDAGPESGSPMDSDRDMDGLCDTTEAQHSTDPDALDTDGDGLPDVFEVLYGWGPTDPDSPARDEVARLEARPGAQLTFSVRFGAEGEDSDFTGSFRELGGLYGDGSSAASFLKSATALSAQPPEAVRGIDGPRQRFLSALGPVLLEIQLLFEVGNDIDTEGCTRVYPFNYAVRDEQPSLVDERSYLLLLQAAGRDSVEDFCLPVDCI